MLDSSKDKLTMIHIVRLLVLAALVFLNGCTTIGSYVVSKPSVYLSEAEFISAEPEKIGFEQRKYCTKNTRVCLPYLFALPYQTTDEPVSYHLHSFSNGVENNVSYRMTPDQFQRFNGTAVLVHGYGGNKRVMLATAMYFRALGMKVIVPDLFGHGDSEQSFQFGAKEHLVLTELLERLSQNEAVLVVGHSMGALPASNLLNAKPVKAAMLLAPMMRFDLAAKEYLPYKSPSMASLFSSHLDEIIQYSLSEAKIQLADTDLRTVLQKSEKPVLMVTSDSDPVSPTEYFSVVNKTNITRIVWQNRSHSSLMLFDSKNAEAIETWLAQLKEFGVN